MLFSGGGAPQNVDYTRSLGRRILAQREEARRGSRESRRREESSIGGEGRKVGSRRETEALSQSMNRGAKLSLVSPHRILPRTDLRFFSLLLIRKCISPSSSLFQSNQYQLCSDLWWTKLHGAGPEVTPLSSSSSSSSSASSSSSLGPGRPSAGRA